MKRILPGFQPVFSVGILDGYLAVPESKQVASGDLDPGAVFLGPGKSPFRKAPVSGDKMPGMVPLSIGKVVKNIPEGFFYLLLAHIFLPVGIGSRRSFKHTIRGHMGQDGFQVMRIESIRERLEKILRHFLSDWAISTKGTARRKVSVANFMIGHWAGRFGIAVRGYRKYCFSLIWNLV